jgi:hypothetical protein
MPFVSSIRDYYSLALLNFRDLENVIRQSIESRDTSRDLSSMVRLFSMWYVGREVLDHPMIPVPAGQHGFLSNSHNVFLEFFKVGGLLFALASFIALFRRCRELVRGGYCTVSPYGLVIALAYTMLFNDLFIGFFLLALSFERVKTPAVEASAIRRKPVPNRRREAPVAALS